MQFVIKRDVLLKSLTLVQGIIERKNTLPILSNVLLDAKGGKLSITATDLDLVFYDEISETKINKEPTIISILEFFKINKAGIVNKEIQIKLKEYVPIIERI